MSDDGKNPGSNTRSWTSWSTATGIGESIRYVGGPSSTAPEMSWETGFSLYQGAQTGTTGGGGRNGGGMTPVVPGASQGQTFLRTEQTGIVYDLISEGEIEGLVNGASGILLNGTRLRDVPTNDAQRSFRTKGSISNGSANITVTSGTLDDVDTDTDEQRYATIYGAGVQPSGITFSISANTTRLVASGSYFTEAMVGGDQGSPEYLLGWTPKGNLEEWLSEWKEDIGL